MRILHVVSDIDDRFGGPSKSVPLLCESLRACGVSSHIIYTKFLSDNQNEVISRAAIPATGVPLTFSRHLYYSSGLRSTLEGLHGERPFDLIHIHSVWRYPAYEAFSAAKRWSIPYVISPRSNFYPESLARSSGRKTLMRRLFVDRMATNAAFVHTTEPGETAAVRDLYPRTAVEMIPNGIEAVTLPKGDRRSIAARHDLPLAENERILLFLARVHPRKGLDVLLDALATVLPHHSDWAVIVAGHCEDDTYLAELKAKALAVGLDKSVRFVGMLRGERKAAAFACADLFILPTYFENFGISIGEALSAGLPVITTSRTPWGAIADARAGWIVPPGDVVALAGALHAATATDTAELISKGKVGRQLAAPFEWAAIGQQMATAYQNALRE